MKRLLLIAFLLNFFPFGEAPAQNEQQAWVARYNNSGANADDNANSIAVDASGNVYVTGASRNAGVNLDYLTIKYSSAGVEQWSTRYNGPGNGDDLPAGIALDAMGNVCVTGQSLGAGTNMDFATVKYDAATGQQIWSARYDQDNFNDYAIALAVDGAGNVCVTGYTEDNGTEYITFKYDGTNGQALWGVGYIGPTDGPDLVQAIAVDASGNVYVTGYSDGDPSAANNFDYATIKYNSAGAQQWVSRYSYSNDSQEVARRITVDDDGNVYVTGRSEGSGTNYDYATVKYIGATGQQQWVSRYNGSGNGFDEANDIALDAAGDIYVTGYSVGSGTSDDCATIKYIGATGATQWAARYNGLGNGRDEGRALALDGANNVYVTGLSRSATSLDYATIKYNAGGVQQWIDSYNGPGNADDTANDLAVDDAGNVYVAGASVGSGTGQDFATIRYTTELFVEAGTNQTVCFGQAATLGGNPAAAGGKSPYAYSWTPTTGLDNPASPNPLASPAATTVYTLTVTDAVGAIATDEVTLTVNPQLTADAGPDQQVCSGQSVTLGGNPTASGGTPPYFYDWLPLNEGSQMPPPEANPTLPPGSLWTTTTYRVHVRDANGCTATDEVTITVNPIIVDAGLDQIILQGESIRLGGNPTVSNGCNGPYTYLWSPPIGLDNPGEANPIATPTTTTTYRLDVIYQLSGLIFSDQVTVTVNPLFTESPTMANLDGGSVAWGDFDNDGDLDILLTGGADSGIRSIVYRNDGNQNFADIGAGANLTAVYNYSSGSWGDFDNDGDLDILLAGDNSSGNAIAKIYRNDGGSFQEYSSSLTGVHGSASWGDYDNDGDLDILLVGGPSLIYRNDSGNFVNINAALPGASKGAWGDYDNDGDLDIVLTNGVYRNDNGSFVDINAGLPSVGAGSVDLGDYDNDGDLDILLTGDAGNGSGSNPLSKVYQNNGGAFADIGAGLQGVHRGSAAWGDYDNDGDLDILLTGISTEIAPPYQYSLHAKVYRNDGGNLFVDIAASLPGVYYSAAAWGDCDNDGDLDVLLLGNATPSNAGPYNKIVRIYRNNITKANTAPAAPAGLAASVEGNTVNLNWNKATDSQTPQNGLTYNLRMGTTPGGSEIVAPMAAAGNGYRRVPALGNTNHKQSWVIKNLPDGTYYWSAQAIDHAFAGSAFATEQSFTVAANHPPQVTSLSINPNPAAEGQLITGTGSFSDPDNDNWTVTIDFGDGSGELELTPNPDKTFSFSHTYADNSAYAVSVRVSDNHVVSAPVMLTMTVNNVAPAVDAGPDTTIHQGETFSGSGSFTDPGADTWVATVNYGEGLPDESLLLQPDKTFTLSHAYNHAGDYTVRVTVTDDNGDSHTDELMVRVNAVPAVANVSPTPNALNVSKTANIVVTFTHDIDPGTLGNNTFRVYASQSGFHPLMNMAYDGETKTATLPLANYNLKAGELVQVTLTDGISSADGTPLIPYSWSFTIHTPKGNGQFENAISLDVGDAQTSIVAGDFDKDGDLDLAVTRRTSSNLAILQNDGRGNYSVASSPAVGREPLSVTTGDFDGDGDLDLAVTHLVEEFISVLFNSGNSNFGARADYQVGQWLDFVAAVDLDRDGDLDLAVTGTYSGSVSILKNNGNGTFQSKVDYHFTRDADDVCVADLDNDGDLDLAAAAWDAPGFTLFENAGNGTYTHKSDITVGLNPVGVFAADLDSDGDMDLAVANQNENTISILQNQGNWGFVQTSISSGSNPNAVIAADWDADGDLDLAVTNYNANTVSILQNAGNGSFAPIAMPAVGRNPRYLTAGDFDSDGDLDLAVANYDLNAVSILKNAGVQALLANAGTDTAICSGQSVTLGGNPTASGGTPPYTYSWTPTDSLDNPAAANPVATPTDTIEYTVQVIDASGVSTTDKVVITVKPLPVITFNPVGPFFNTDPPFDLSTAVSPNGGNFSGPGVSGSMFSPATAGIGTHTIEYVFIDGNGCIGHATQNITVNALFSEISTSLPGVQAGSVAWGDFDSDGDLDILLTGNTGSTRISKVYRNDSGNFVDIGAGLSGVYDSSVAWGDYDNDGDLDVLLAGHNGSTPISKVYRNDSGNFVDIGAGLSAVTLSSVAWGDYDNDGDLDILLTGFTASATRISKVYRNDNGNFVDIGAGLSGVHGGSVAWGDYDNDGDLDILLTGWNGSTSISKVYRNENGNFVDIGAELSGVYSSSVVWGDYDNDGDLDILLTGHTGSTPVSKVYRNDSGNFVDVGAGLAGVLDGSVAWGDYDNDGDLDILLTGVVGSTAISKVYRNDSGSFVDIGAELSGVFISSVAWGDYNNDGDLDILLTGHTGSTNISKVYRNNTTTPNTTPAAPAGLAASVVGNAVTFNWNKATDNQTPQNGLTYNLRVGSTPGGSEIVAPMAAANNGYRRVPALGNTNQNQSWAIKNLPNGTYYWGVQAIDHAFAGSAFAAERSFTVAVNHAPVADALNVSMSEDQAVAITLTGSDADGDTLTFAIISGPTHGTLSGNPPNIIYTPALDFNGEDSLTFKVNDGKTDSEPATVSITVDPVNDVPVVQTGPDTVLNEGETFSRTVSFTDPDGNDWVAEIDYDSDGAFDYTLSLTVKTFALNHLYADNGNYPVIVRVIDDTGVSGSDTLIVVVNNVVPVVNAGPDTTIHHGETFSGSGTFTDPGADTWVATVNYGGGLADEPLQLNPDKTFTLSHVYTHAGDYTVRVTVTDDDGGSHTDTLTVMVLNDALLANAGPDTTICSGQSVTLGGNPTAIGGTPPYTYSWAPTDSLDNPAAANPVAKPTSTTEYTVQVIDASGVSVTDKVVITVKPLPAITFQPVGPFCVNVVQVDLATWFATGQVSPAGGTFSGPGISGQVFDPAAAGAGTHTITYTFTDGNGCSNSASQQVTVNPEPNVTFNSVGPFFNTDPPVDLSTAVSPSGGNFSGPGVSGNMFNPATAGIGTHLISYDFADSNGCTGRADQNITVNALFSEISTSLPGVNGSSVAWGDYDNDGDLDILLTGHTGSTPVSKVYRNDGGNFVDIGAGLSGVYSGSVAWGDYDNDGDLDILLTGHTGSTPVSKVYRNDGGNFVDSGAELSGIHISSVAWGDYDNDGDLDILLTGQYAGLPFISKVYRNDSGNFVDIGAGLSGIQNGSVAWGDYDNDGDLDILLTGSSASGIISKVYRNDNGNFVDIGAGLSGVYFSSVAWGDYDNDGDLDILLRGSSASGAISKIYRNNSGNFVDIGAGLSGVSTGSVAWGDYDNDGDLDILLTGSSPGKISKVYRNDSGNFVDIGAGLSGVENSSVAWGDYDNDGDLDILLTGYTGSTRIAKIYGNNITTPNTAPAAPAGLAASVAGNAVTFNWNKATDNQTPQNGLTYNLRMGTTPGGSEIVAPMAAANDGYRRVPALGNTNHNQSWAIKNLPNGTYYWSTQAIDHTFAGSPFAAEQSFTVALNHAPVAISQSVRTPEDHAVAITLTGSDVNGDTLAFAILSGPAHGTLSGTPPNVIYTPALNFNGSDSLTFKVNDGKTDSAPATVWILVTPVNDVPVVQAGPDTVLSEGDTFSRTVSFTDPDGNNWLAEVDYDGDGAFDYTLQLTVKTFALNHLYADNGNYPVIVRVTDDAGQSGSDALTVVVNNVAPVVNAGPDTTIHHGETFSSSGSFTDPGADSWVATVNYGGGLADEPLQWNANEAFTLSHVYTNAGEYTVRVTVTDDDGGSHTDTLTVTVINDALVVNAGPDQQICLGETITLGGNPAASEGMPPYTYSWTPAAGLDDPTSANPAANPTITTNYTVEVSDASGVIATDQVLVTVRDANTNCIAPPAGLISWWPGDGNASDLIGANRGTLLNGATFANGKVGQAFSFDGVNDGVNLPENNLANAEVTVAAWVKLSATQRSRIFVAKYYQTPTRGFALGISDDADNIIKWYTSTDAGSNNTLFSNTVLANDRWYYVVATFDGTTKKLYIDGELESSVVWANAIGYTATVSSFGYLWAGNDQHFNGLIDEVDIYNRALTTDEIRLLFEAGCAGKCKQILRADAGPDTLICAGQSVTIGGSPTATGGTAPYTYSWTSAGSVSDPNAANPTASPGSTTEYIVAVTDANGQTATDTVVVTVNTSAVVGSHQKINEINGGFAGDLDMNDWFGAAVATLGDLDGDGVTDLAVGTPHDGDGGTERGAVWMLFMKTDGTVKAQQKISATQGGFTGTLDDVDQFGNAVTGLGDLDRDGVPDLAVGAPHDGDGGYRRGAIWVLFMNADGTIKSHQKISATTGGFTGALQDEDKLGYALAALGDLDGDGVVDFAAGAPATYTDHPALWIIFMNINGTVKTQQKINATEGGFTGVPAPGAFGGAVAALGDLDNDGAADLAVSETYLFDDQQAKGAFWILFLNPNGTIKAQQRVSDTEGGFTGAINNGDFFGRSLASVGDLDSDGVSDMAVGASQDGYNDNDEGGAVWLLFMKADGTVKSHQKIGKENCSFTGVLDSYDRFGFAVNALGDFNRDGVTDLAVGAPLDDGVDPSQGNEIGAVWVLFLKGNSASLAAHAGEDQTASPVILGDTPTATGGVPPYYYKWTPVSGLSNATIPHPTAMPAVATEYVLEVTDASGKKATDQVTVAGVVPPAAPSHLTATAISSNQINLAWTDNASNEDGFKVERQAAGDTSFIEIASLSANMASYSNTGLNAATVYSYRVRAHRSGNSFSGYSNVASDTTLLGAPNNLAATAMSTAQINLSWSDQSNNEDGFKIERKTGVAGTYAEIAAVGADVTTFSNTGLGVGTGYFYRVRAFNANGNSAYSNEAKALTFMNGPASLTATAVSSSQINLTWTEAVANETGFEVERRTGAAGTYAKITTVAKNATSYSDLGLSAGTTYFYRVRAVSATNVSAYTNEANATPLVVSLTPMPPESLKVTTASKTQLNLSWLDKSNNEAGFKIERKTGVAGTYAEIATVGAGVTTFFNTGLGVGTGYYYRVRAFNANGNSAYSNEANALTFMNGPANLTATAMSSSQINLAWTEAVANETGFEVERKTGAAGTYAKITTVAKNATSYSDIGLSAGTTYFYRVRAISATNVSGYTNEASATPLVVSLTPMPPESLKVTTASKTQLNLSWLDKSNNEAGFKIERKTGVAGTYAEITVVGAGVTTFSNTGLGVGTGYYYRVRAFNANGNSSYSNEANALTFINGPANLTATAMSSSQINLAWTEAVANETGFEVERKTGAAGTYAKITTVAKNATSYSDIGLSAGTTYFYRVRAISATNVSGYTNEASATPLVVSLTPMPPESLKVTTASKTQLNLSWLDKSNNEAGFKIERKTGVAGTYAEITAVGAGVTTFSNTGLGVGTGYFYRVRAFNANGNSSYSNEANALTFINGPANLTATAMSSSQINLAWTEAVANETGFEVERKTGVAGTYVKITTVAKNATSYSDIGLSAGTTYFYRVRAVSATNVSDYTNETNANTGIAKAAENGTTDDETKSAVIPEEISLAQNYPNPFSASGASGSPSTTISYSLPEDMHVSLEVVNLTGNVVATLVKGYRGRGIHRVAFKAKNLPSGVYYAVLKAGAATQVQRMTLLK